jgi:hypothetical protein
MYTMCQERLLRYMHVVHVYTRVHVRTPDVCAVSVCTRALEQLLRFIPCATNKNESNKGAANYYYH